MASLIFDFPDAGTGRPVRTTYRDPVRIVQARRVEDVLPALAEIEAAVADGLHAAGFLAYEAAPAFEPRMRVRGGGRLPLVWFGLFGGLGSTSTSTSTSTSGLAGEWVLEPERGEYERAIGAVREAIAEGRTYQVNFTGRLRADLAAEAGGRSLYGALRRAQGSGWHALLELEGHTIVSVSPELFFRVSGRAIETRPMKGTRPRGRWVEEDDALAAELASSEKDRAENLMIVDLLRNDLGRICETGSVRVPRLFGVERYRTVWQMTSSVEGTLRGDVGLTGILGALFPCGSVTGAPKISTMELIAALESSPREVYCGAIGVIRPGGDMAFNVPIRTLWLDHGRGRAEYGTGGGIVWDSTAAAEYEELLAKAVVIREPWPEFELVETMAAEAGVILRLDRHLRRMARSAAYFDFPFPDAAIRRALADTAPEPAGSGGGSRRVRLTLAGDGRFQIVDGPLGVVGAEAPGSADGSPDTERDSAARPLGAERAAPLPVAVARSAVHSGDRFLFHKTTHRAAYDAALADSPGVFDVLLFNERGEVTEFTRGNVVAELDDRRVTPSVGAGLLAGCYRAELLEAGTVTEATIRVADLRRATGLWFINSARRWVPVSITQPDTAGGRPAEDAGGRPAEDARPGAAPPRR
jgi:para-aminobenzoate synthetase / 4-amino-4-deoxychorismate lyase